MKPSDPGFWFIMAPAVASGALFVYVLGVWAWDEITELWEKRRRK